MVHIINGEIVADDDPRVKAKLNPGSANDAARRRSNIAGLNSSGPATGGGGLRTPSQHPNQGPSPLQGLAQKMGLEGNVTIPGFMGYPPKPVEKIYLVIAAILVFMFGWRALVFIVFAFIVSLQQPGNGGAPQTGGPPNGPGHGIGGVSGVRRL